MTNRKSWVGGNWKCNGTQKQVSELIKMLDNLNTDKVDVAVFPSTIHIHQVESTLKNKKVIVGAQNISKTDNGAFTGETSVSMLIDAGINWTLVGHSERRTLYHETDEMTAEKIKIAQEKGINVCFCIGETLQEREANKTNEVCSRQIKAVISQIKKWDSIVIAYEPVWAIGTGKVATTEQAQDAHKAIRELIQQAVSDDVAQKVRIVYGGSVNGKNCGELIKMPDIDGFLVGGASLKPEFEEIVKTAGQN